MLSRISALLALATLATATLACAADDKDLTVTDPKKAGADYDVQGEYVGTVTSDGEEHKWGAQIIALGGGKFDAVGFAGGLPGEGWQRGDQREMTTGETRNGEAVFESDDYRLSIKDGTLTVFADGQKIGELKKTKRESSTLGKKPPKGAVVLFDGTSADAFAGGKLTDDGHLLANCQSKQAFGDHSLHLEFRTPFKPYARGQARGNSGLYVQSRYEIQVLDSFGLEGENNECGGIYLIAKPDVNMCLPPLTWQTYDVDFTAARYEGDKKVKNARITVKHNGVVIHDDLELPHGTPVKLADAPGPAPIYLQGHGNPVVYRNIWVVEKKAE